MYGQFVNAGTMYVIFVLLSVFWILALIYIMFDADELYGTGWFWFICVLVVPVIAIPVYGLMKLGTHRSWKAEMAALDRQERKRALGQRFSGIALDLDKLGHDPPADPTITDDLIGPATGFVPFRPTYAATAEDWRKKLTERVTEFREDAAQAGRQAAINSDHGAIRDESSSQGCGDSTKGREVNERLSWRAKHLKAQSRWTPSRSGGLTRATREDQPF